MHTAHSPSTVSDDNALTLTDVEFVSETFELSTGVNKQRFVSTIHDFEDPVYHAISHVQQETEHTSDP